MYAVGPRGLIDIKVAASDEPEVTYIHRILLYEVDDDSDIALKPSMIVGRNYYVVAEYTTNKPSSIDITSSNTMIVDDSDLETSIRDSGHLKEQTRSRIAIIRVSAEELSNAGDLTVGWNKIGNVENVRATYLVTSAADAPSIYANYADTDGDRIDDTLDRPNDDATSLPVTINGRVMPGVNILQTSESHPLFMTDVGLLIALRKGSNAEDYSAANIEYDDIDERTKEFLGQPSLVETIATFGVETEYEIGEDGSAKAAVAYITFPVESSLEGDLYLRYSTQTGVWRQFERATAGYPDTWYAIERTNTSEACSTDPETYRAMHDLGAHEHNCIMVVITDGGPYDSNDDLDGRIIGLLSIGPYRRVICVSYQATVLLC